MLLFAGKINACLHFIQSLGTNRRRLFVFMLNKDKNKHCYFIMAADEWVTPAVIPKLEPQNRSCLGWPSLIEPQWKSWIFDHEHKWHWAWQALFVLMYNKFKVKQNTWAVALPQSMRPSSSCFHMAYVLQKRPSNRGSSTSTGETCMFQICFICLFHVSQPYLTIRSGVEVTWEKAVGADQGVVSPTFRELSKIMSRKYTIPDIKFVVRISSWNVVVCP